MKICYIGNIASHYRAEVFSRMCKDLSCDFYFGQPYGSISNIKTLPLSFFTTHAEMLHNTPILFIGGYWQRGAIGLLRRAYDLYIITGDIACLSTWVLMIFNRLFFHKRIVLWGHGWYGRESFPKTIIKKIYYALSDRILVYGDRAKDLMAKGNINPRKIFPVHNSLDYDRQKEAIRNMPSVNPIREYFKNDYPAIVFSGRLMASKRIDMIIDALAELKKENIFVNCVLIGDGPEKQNLQTLVDKYDLHDHFWFYGPCYDELIIGSMYWNASVCVSPGNVGLTAIHSLTYGCPVITHDNFAYQMPEFEAIEPGKTGDFFEQNNNQALKAHIRKWVVLSGQNKSSIRKACMDTVQREWTPDYQIKVIKECCCF